MDDYSAINFVIKLVLFLIAIWFIAKHDKKSIIVQDNSDKDDSILIRGTIFSRLFNLNVKSVKQSDIVKIQRTGKCISIFNKSDNAYDIFTFTESASDVFNQAKKAFPQAKTVEITT